MNESTHGKKHPRVSLKVIDAPRTGPVVNAPPALIASTHTIDYCCGYCGTVLMHAKSDQVFNLQIRALPAAVTTLRICSVVENPSNDASHTLRGTLGQ